VKSPASTTWCWPANELGLNGASHPDRLQLALMLEGQLPVGDVVRKQRRPERRRRRYLGNERDNGKAGSARRDVLIHLTHRAEGPRARDRRPLARFHILGPPDSRAA
jgi:hypothetical protein